MTEAPGHPDDEPWGIGFGALVAQGASVDTTGGLDLLGGVAAQLGHAYQVVVHAATTAAIALEAEWSLEGAPAGVTVKSTATLTPDASNTGSALLTTLGHTLVSLTATGGDATTSFAVAGSGQRPLPSAAPAASAQEMWPTFYTIPFESAAAFDDYNGALSGGWLWVIDALCKGNGYFHPAAAGINKFFDFKLNLGPEYSVWTVTTMLTTGPNGGKPTVRLLKLAEYDDQRPAGYWANPAGLTSEYIFGSGVFSSPVDTQDTYSAVLTRNVDYLSLLFRIGAAPGTNAMTTPTLAADADGYLTLSTGPGLYQVRVIVDGKNVASANYDYRPQVMTFSRVDGHGNA